jgi:hypothetical protein
MEVINQKYFRGLSSLRMMEQKTGFVPMSFKIRKGHFLIKPYNEIIHRLEDAGITEFLINLRTRKNEKIADFGPQILSLEELKICFLVCFSPLMLALIVFVFEVLWNQFKNGCFARVQIMKKVLTEKRKQNNIAITNFFRKKLKTKNHEHFPIRKRSKTSKAIED